MSFLDVMNAYFRGEKLEAWFFILPVGVLLAGLAIVALKVERGGYAWGVAIPCILAGLLFIGTGIGVGARTDGQVAEVTQAYESAPAAMVKEELPRMEKVNANFRTTFIVFGALTALSLVLIFALRAGWAQGVGSALILVSAIGFLIDGFAGRRAVPYTEALEDLAQQQRAGPSGEN
jgi:hypothetical protein